MLFIGFGILGTIAALRMPVSLFPGTEAAGVTVETEYTGATPDKIEELITKPLEQSLSVVGGVENIFSVTEFGKSRVHVELATGSDQDLLSLELRERVDLVATAFPQEVRYPVLLKYDPSQRPVMIVSMDSASRSLTEIRDEVERRLKKTLQALPGVSEVHVAGGRIREVQVECDRLLMEQHGISMAQILALLQENNLDIAAGRVDEGGGRFPIYVRARFRSVHEIRSLVVTRGAAGPVRVADVARVEFAHREKESAARVDGKERVAIYIQKAGGADLLALSGSLRQKLNEEPVQGVTTAVLYDQADTIVGFLHKIALRVPVALALVAAALLWLHASVRVALLGVLAIPYAISGGAFSLYLLSYDLNLLTISGLLVGGGLGLLPAILSAAGHSADSRRAAHVLVGLCLAAFLPLTLAGPDVRTVYGGFATSITAALIFAAGYGILLVPALTHVFSEAGEAPLWVRNLESWVSRSAAWQSGPLARWKHSVSRASPLQAIVDRPRPFLLGWALLVGGAPLLLSQVPFENTNPLELNRLQGAVELPSGTSFEGTDDISLKVERQLAADPAVAEVTSRVEPGRSTLNIRLRPGVNGTEALIQKLTRSLGDRQPAFVYLSSSAGAGDLSELTVDVLGEDLIVLDRTTRLLAERAGSIPGTGGVVLRYKSPRPELRLTIDRAKADLAGLTVREVGQRVRFALQGGVATKFIEDTTERDIRFRLSEDQRRSLDDLRRLTLVNGEGKTVPLAELVHWQEGVLPVKLYRKNKKRALSFSLRPGSQDPDMALEQIRMFATALALPQGYRIEVGSDFRKIRRARSDLLELAFLSLGLSFLVLCGITESFTIPLRLAIPLPPVLSALGVGLLLGGQRMSVSLLLALVVAASLVVTMGWLAGRSPQRFLARHGSLYAGLAAFFLPLVLIAGDAVVAIRQPAACILLVLVLSLAVLTASGALESALSRSLGRAAAGLQERLSRIVHRVRRSFRLPGTSV